MIGELSRRSGVSRSALRFYERKGLISSTRTDGNQRRYLPSTLRRVAFVQAGAAAGIPLGEVKAALDTLPRGKAPTKREWERLSRRWRHELDERIGTLEALRDRLTTCIGCGCLSLRTCALLNPGDEAGSLGAGARYLRRVSPRERAVARRAV
ncbi:MAG TPA: redox-sensitive transcriptional activator SoxR [Gaiellaceae bacterium]|nr:redox-sensitive transcriptional activator SoxR [Gaiellaceae bacterium]